MPAYDNLKIPLEFREKFEKLNTRYNLGYSTYPEFVKDSIRRRFEEIRQLYSPQGNSATSRPEEDSSH